MAHTFLNSLQLKPAGVCVNSLCVSTPQYSGLENGVKFASPFLFPLVNLGLGNKTHE